MASPELARLPGSWWPIRDRHYATTEVCWAAASGSVELRSRCVGSTCPIASRLRAAYGGQHLSQRMRATLIVRAEKDGGKKRRARFDLRQRLWRRSEESFGRVSRRSRERSRLARCGKVLKVRCRDLQRSSSCPRNSRGLFAALRPDKFAHHDGNTMDTFPAG